MTEDGVKALLAAITADMLVQQNQPWAGTAGVALVWGGPWVMRRTSAALDIVRKQLQHIRKDLSDSQREELAAMLNRYLRNAQEGAAERNLRLIAKVMAGMLERDAVYADAFLRDANVLSDLTANEIIVLGSIWKATEGDGIPRDLGRDLRTTERILVPTVFSDFRKLIEAGSALLRTGYLMPLSTSSGHMVYRTTAAYERLAELANFDTLDTTEPLT